MPKNLHAIVFISLVLVRVIVSHVFVLTVIVILFTVVVDGHLLLMLMDWRVQSRPWAFATPEKNLLVIFAHGVVRVALIVGG